MGMMASQITSLTIVYSTVYSGTDQRKHRRSASLAFARGIHRWPVNSLHKGPVMRKKFPFDDVIMYTNFMLRSPRFQLKSNKNSVTNNSFRFSDAVMQWCSVQNFRRIHLLRISDQKISYINSSAATRLSKLLLVLCVIKLLDRWLLNTKSQSCRKVFHVAENVMLHLDIGKWQKKQI